MINTSKQLKTLVRNMSGGDNAKAQIIVRNYIMERFIERLSISQYRNNMILKGGVLMAAVIGLNNRSTLDIDASFKNLSLTEENAQKIVEEIISIQIDDGVTFEIQSAAQIMDEANYSGIRLILNTTLETMRGHLKIDFSTGDVITPQEILYPFRLMFEERTIPVLAYNLETVLAEKIETFLARGTANTRMRDFYDIYALEKTQVHNINKDVLKAAFNNTSEKRGSSALIETIDLALQEAAHSPNMIALWKNYQNKFEYAADIAWEDVLQSIRRFCDIIRS